LGRKPSSSGSASPEDRLWASVPAMSNGFQSHYRFADPGDAFDHVVDAALITIGKVTEARQAGRDIQNVEGYMYRTGVYSFFRKKQENARLLPLGNWEHIDSNYQETSRLDNVAEVAERITHEILKLNEKDQLIVLLRAEGMPFEEIATCMNLNCPAVRKRHSRATMEIRKAVMRSI
jgi:DNA-directed RNA polymerase specialized sigma24 family protein